MERSAILKRTGIALGSFIVITVIMFFLYPYLNEEKRDEIVSGIESSEEMSDDTDGIRLGKEFKYLNDQIEYYKREQSRLLAMIDSLQSSSEEMKRDYEQQIAELIEQNANVQSFAEQRIPQQNPAPQQEEPQEPAGRGQGQGQAQFVADAGNVGMEMNQEAQEEFFNKVKSFLNLDEEELAPIVSNLNNDELVRLYKGGGTIQREKLLRSLKPEKAAEIMKVIML